MGLAIGLLSFVLVLTCLLLGLLILIQLPKKEAGGIGQAFGGGATDALFGTGSGNALTKATKYAAGTFVVLCVVVSWLTALQSRSRTKGVQDVLNKTVATQPAAPVAAPAAPPPPAPAAAPAPARNYIVFFDFDKADLKSDAQTVVRQAAQGFKNSTGVTRIEATGHADRAGTPAYNMKLSQRRAEAVRAELIAQGVPANAITIAAKGETQPLVQTADGVREPQNRRVEIVLR